MNLAIYIVLLITTAWIQPILSLRCYSCNQTNPACVDADVDKMSVEDCGQDGFCLYFKKADGGYIHIIAY